MKPQYINRRRPQPPRITPPQPWEICIVCFTVLLALWALRECRNAKPTNPPPPAAEVEIHLLKAQNEQ